MTVTATWYGKALANIFGGETAGESLAVDFLSDDIKVMLCTSTYSPNKDTHETKSDVTNEVANGNGYTTRGASLASKTVTYDAVSHTVKLDAADTAWANSTITARYAVVYKDTGVDGTSVLLGYVDFGQDESSSNGTFTIQWASGGILTLTAS